MDKNKERTSGIAYCAALGLRIGAIFVGLAATVLLAVNIYRACTGGIGWEVAAIPAFCTAFYLGWAFSEERTRQRRAEARKEREERWQQAIAELEGIFSENTLYPNLPRLPDSRQTEKEDSQ